MALIVSPSLWGILVNGYVYQVGKTKIVVLADVHIENNMQNGTVFCKGQRNIIENVVKSLNNVKIGAFVEGEDSGTTENFMDTLSSIFKNKKFIEFRNAHGLKDKFNIIHNALLWHSVVLELEQRTVLDELQDKLNEVKNNISHQVKLPKYKIDFINNFNREINSIAKQLKDEDVKELMVTEELLEGYPTTVDAFMTIINRTDYVDALRKAYSRYRESKITELVKSWLGNKDVIFIIVGYEHIDTIRSLFQKSSLKKEQAPFFIKDYFGNIHKNKDLLLRYNAKKLTVVDVPLLSEKSLAGLLDILKPSWWERLVSWKNFLIPAAAVGTGLGTYWYLRKKNTTPKQTEPAAKKSLYVDSRFRSKGYKGS